MSDTDATHYTRIGGDRLYVTIEGSRWRWTDAGNQCEDCGADDYRLHRDRAGKVDCLICDVCQTPYPLLPV